MATIVGDVTGLLQRHHPKNIPYIVEKIESFPLNANRFEIMQHTKNSGEGFLQPPPPSPTLYYGGGINLRVRLRVKGVFLWDDPDQDQ